MKVRIDGPGEYDRHDDEVRFVAFVERQRVDVSITTFALARIADARGQVPSQPLTMFAASGQLLNEILISAIQAAGELQSTYLLTHQDVLRVTGHEEGLPHVPRPWKPR